MEFNVPKMSCGHCTGAIEKAVKSADTDATVVCDLTNRKVTVQSRLSRDRVAEVIKNAGYDTQITVT